MNTDALSRRLRFAKPNPLVSRILLQEADFLMFDAIERHGPLPMPYLYEFAKEKRKSYINTQKRLTELYNGDGGGAYLTRPSRQFDAYEARYQHLVYDLSERGKDALAAYRRRPLKFPKPRSNSFVHDLMAACVTASIELAARERGLRFISREEILYGAPPTDDDLLAIVTGGRKHKPDDLFGLEGEDEKGKWWRYGWLEADLSNERIRSTDKSQTVFGAKLSAIADFIKHERYGKKWGIKHLQAFIATTSPGRKDNLMEFVEAEAGPLAKKFLFAVEPCFGARYAQVDQHWRVPKEVISFAWETPISERDIYKP